MPIRRVRSFYPAFEKNDTGTWRIPATCWSRTRPHSVHAVFVGIPAPYLFRNISRWKEFGERLYLAEEKIKCALIWQLLQPPR